MIQTTLVNLNFKLLINILLQTSIKINIVEIEWEFPTLGEIIV